MFDLPVGTAAEVKAATQFRKALLKNGFTMFQYSVYIKHVPSAESADVYMKRVRLLRPPSGEVMIVRITDKQFGDIVTIRGSGKQRTQGSDGLQLDIF